VDARLAELESAPAREARWEYLPTGVTYRSVWEGSNLEQKGDLLRRSGITIAAGIDLGLAPRRTASNPGAYHFEIRIRAEVKSNLG
jgi:site-specific DNA recombinase